MPLLDGPSLTGGRLLLVMLALGVGLSACTRENPAFRDSRGADDGSSSDTTATIDTMTGTSSDESGSSEVGTSTDGSTSETGMSTEPVPLCGDMPKHEDIRLYFRNDTQLLSLECSAYHGNYWLATGTTATELLLTGPCDGDCTQCGLNEVAFGFEPMGMSEEPNSDTQCLYIAGEEPIVDPNPVLDTCYFKHATFFASPGPPEPLLVISADGAVPSILTGLPGPTGNDLSVAITKDLECECADVPWCCEDIANPETYKMLPSGASNWAYMGQGVNLDWGPFTYEFINARSYRSGECDLPAALTWFLIAEDPNNGG